MKLRARENPAARQKDPQRLDHERLLLLVEIVPARSPLSETRSGQRVRLVEVARDAFSCLLDPGHLGFAHARNVPPVASASTTVCQPSRVGREVEDAARPCPMCGATTWILLDGMSTLQALEGGLQALAFSCDRCGFIRWHRKDKVDAEAS